MYTVICIAVYVEKEHIFRQVCHLYRVVDSKWLSISIILEDKRSRQWQEFKNICCMEKLSIRRGKQRSARQKTGPQKVSMAGAEARSQSKLV